jgi:hypothetical protein
MGFSDMPPEESSENPAIAADGVTTAPADQTTFQPAQ